MTEASRSSRADLRRARVWAILEPAAESRGLWRAVGYALLALIFANVAAVVLETVDSVRARFGGFFRWFEVASVAIFTVEYVLRVWACPASSTYAGSVRGRLRFIRSPMAIIDLLAILPSYLPAVTTDLRFLRMMRLFRIFRLAKLARYSSALHLLGRVVRSRKEDLAVAAVIMLLFLVSSASLIYFAERDAQPDKFTSIPDALWWATVTMTTVGYGDVFPVTTLGRIVGGIVAILGIGMFALPTGILGAAFLEEIQRRHGKRRCPHCGREID